MGCRRRQDSIAAPCSARWPECRDVRDHQVTYMFETLWATMQVYVYPSVPAPSALIRSLRAPLTWCHACCCRVDVAEVCTDWAGGFQTALCTHKTALLQTNSGGALEQSLCNMPVVSCRRAAPQLSQGQQPASTHKEVGCCKAPMSAGALLPMTHSVRSQRPLCVGNATNSENYCTANVRPSSQKLYITVFITETPTKAASEAVLLDSPWLLENFNDMAVYRPF